MDDNNNPERPLRPKVPASPPAPNGFPMRTRPQDVTSNQEFTTRQAQGATPQSSVGSSDVSEGPMTTPEGMAPSSLSAARPKRKKRLLLALISLAAVLLILTLTYVYWYQNPNKVVADALVNTVNAKSFAYTGGVTTTGATKMNVTLDGGVSPSGGTVNAKFTIDARSKKYTFDGNGLMDDKSDLYFKVRNIDDLVNNYRSGIPVETRSLFDKIIAKVNDKWIKVSTSDLKKYNQDVATAQKCTAEAVKKLQNDAATKSELASIYKRHPFIAIDKKLEPKDGSFGYVLKTNPDVSKAFTKEYKNSALYTSLKSCDSGFIVKGDDLFNDNSAAAPQTINVWVDQWSHQLTKIDVNRGGSSDAVNFSLKPTFNKLVAVSTPSGATTLEQLQKDVQELIQSAQTAAPSGTGQR